MRVVVYEPDPTGHHFAYLSHVLPAIARLGCEPILLTTCEAAKSPQFSQHLGAIADQFVVDMGGTKLAKTGSIRASWKQLSELKEGVARLKPDHLYLAYGDDLVQVVGLSTALGFRPWGFNTTAEVLLLRGGYSYPARRLGKRLRMAVTPPLIRRGPWDRIHHLNPDDLVVLARGEDPSVGRFRLMPDPVEPPPQITLVEARRQLGLPEEGRYLGSVGLLDRRKGIDLLALAWKRLLPHRRVGDRLLLAGPARPEITNMLQRHFADDIRQGGVILIDRQLTTAEINVAVAALDVVCTPYPTHNSSASIVIRAAAAGRPVLGSAIGWMNRTITQFRLGNTCDVANTDVFVAAIVNSLDTSVSYVPTDAARRFATYHSDRNFVAHWTALLRQRLTLPSHESLRDWNWVISNSR